MLEHIEEVYEITPLQRLMLQALILEAPHDRECFSRWSAQQVDFDAVDKLTTRLVPALFWKFKTTGVANPGHARMKEIYRHYHFRNSLLFADCHRTLARMLDAGIDVLLFKGAAIALKYHRNVALRPMGDMDVLVRRESLPKAEQILLECGWKYGYPESKKRSDLHSHDYINARFSGFDLHWHSLLESAYTGSDDGIWERAEFFDWDGLVVKLMAPEDLLLTSLVNGVRDNPPRPEWIYDVAKVVAAEPVVLWEILWTEAKKRDLRINVFDALNLIRGISPKTVPDALLEGFLEGDRDFRRSLPFSESRTFGLNAADTNVDDIAASPLEAPQHIRYFRNKDGAIDRLFLRWRHLPLVAELFEVNDHAALDRLVANLSNRGEGFLDIPPGLLATNQVRTLPTYSANISVVNRPRKLVLSPGEIAEIGVEVENNSQYCWPVHMYSNAQFGLSYHLLSTRGEMLIRDFPRSFLASARNGYVAFIEPSQKIGSSVKVVAPDDPGHYVIQFDLVHELITWFSDHGMQFPRIDLEVRRAKSIKSYVVSGPWIVHESIGFDTVIINTSSGAYYSTQGYGSIIWNALHDGCSPRRIASAFASANICEPNSKIVELFISRLIAEQLIVASEMGEKKHLGALPLKGTAEFGPPILIRHLVQREMTAIHPVSGGNTQAGWPPPDDSPT